MAFFTAEQAAALTRSAWLAELQFKSETIRAWAGFTTLTTAGPTEWRPTKGVVRIEGLGFNAEPRSRQVTLSLPGVDNTFLTKALAETEEADQQPILIYLQGFDNDWQTQGGLIPIFTGLMQPPRISRGQVEGFEGTTQIISLPCEDFMFNRSRPPNGRYTSSDQNKRTSPTDNFFNFMPSLISKTFVYPDY